MGLKFFVYLDDAFGSHQEDSRRPVAFIERKGLILPVSLLVRRNPNGSQYKWASGSSLRSALCVLRFRFPRSKFSASEAALAEFCNSK